MRYDDEEEHNLSWKQLNLTSDDSYSSHENNEKNMHLNNKYSLNMLTRHGGDRYKRKM
jgi:hypothetical protein